MSDSLKQRLIDFDAAVELADADLKRLHSLVEHAASTYGLGHPIYKSALCRFSQAYKAAGPFTAEEVSPLERRTRSRSGSDGHEETERSEVALLWELGWPLLIGRIADEIASLSLGVFTGRMETIDQAAQYNVVSGQQFTLVFIFGAQQALYTMVHNTHNPPPFISI